MKSSPDNSNCDCGMNIQTNSLVEEYLSTD